MKIKVVVHPKSKNPRVEKSDGSETHIYVREPATEGKANAAVIRVLSGLYKTSRSQIELVSGARSRTKVFRIGPN